MLKPSFIAASPLACLGFAFSNFAKKNRRLLAVYNQLISAESSTTSRLGSITSRCSGKWARTHPPSLRGGSRPDPGDGGNRAYFALMWPMLSSQVVSAWNGYNFICFHIFTYSKVSSFFRSFMIIPIIFILLCIIIDCRAFWTWGPGTGSRGVSYE